MKNFAAIDFETANRELSSVCSVGVVVVRSGEIMERFYSLIRPEPEYYSYWNTRVHGLQLEDTACSPVFPEVWKKVEPLVAGLPFVAHNSPFDEGCLRAVFRTYQMDYPDYRFFALAGLPAVYLGKSCQTINCRRWLRVAVMTSGHTTMPWQMQRLAL